MESNGIVARPGIRTGVTELELQVRQPVDHWAGSEFDGKFTQTVKRIMIKEVEKYLLAKQKTIRS